MLIKFKRKIKPFSHFIWLFLLVLITFFVTYFYENNKDSQKKNLKKTLNNVYLQKTLAKITSGLKDRYTEFEYVVKGGDSFESIIYEIKIPQNEKRLFLETVKKNKQIKILRPNQKLYFKIDKKNNPKIKKFIIEVNKKKRDTLRKKFRKKYF